jgi:ATP-binding cassette, subfamily D (ALD), peroxisomal long-chain fatty acid import protein
MYEHAKSLGITLITISLRSVSLCPSEIIFLCVLPPRPSLAKYHTQLLTLSGDGTRRWTLARIGTAEARIGIDREIGILESKLKEVEQWELRVKEIERLLGVQ